MAAQRAQMAIVEQQKARIEAEKAKAEAEYKTQLAAIQKETDEKLAHATSDIERARIREEATRQAMAVRSRRGSGSRSSSSGESSSSQNKIKSPGKHEISDNPLEGL
jgi:predicted ATPase